MLTVRAAFCTTLCASTLMGQGKVLRSAFTPTAIQVDGKAEEAWSKAEKSEIDICMNAQRTVRLNDCKVSGAVQAMWNGPVLYLLVTVSDPAVDTSAAQDTRRSGVQVFVDQFDDKFPKFEEDDGYFIVSAAGQQSGNRTNAGLMYYPAVWSTHLISHAALARMDSEGKQTLCGNRRLRSRCGMAGDRRTSRLCSICLRQ